MDVWNKLSTFIMATLTGTLCFDVITDTRTAKSQPNPLDKYEHVFYSISKRHIGGEGRAHETGIPPTPSPESSAPISPEVSSER